MHSMKRSVAETSDMVEIDCSRSSRRFGCDPETGHGKIEQVEVLLHDLHVVVDNMGTLPHSPSSFRLHPEAKQRQIAYFQHAVGARFASEVKQGREAIRLCSLFSAWTRDLVVVAASLRLLEIFRARIWLSSSNLWKFGLVWPLSYGNLYPHILTLRCEHPNLWLMPFSSQCSQAYEAGIWSRESEGWGGEAWGAEEDRRWVSDTIPVWWHSSSSPLRHLH